MARTAYHFFYKHAGYSYGAGETRRQGRIRSAQAYAAAEKWAESDPTLVFVWLDDPDCTEDSFEFEEDKRHVREYGAVGCVLYRQCPEHGTDCKHAEHLASLWGITESLNNAERDAHRRVVQAELALEAMPDHD